MKMTTIDVTNFTKEQIETLERFNEYLNSQSAFKQKLILLKLSSICFIWRVKDVITNLFNRKEV